jgi:hypothetical protein
MYSYCYVYVFLLTCMLCSAYSLPTGTLRLPWLRFFRAFSSVLRQMQEYTSQRRGTVRTLPEFCCSMYCLCRLCCSMYCLCVNVYCTTATRCQPNCSSIFDIHGSVHRRWLSRNTNKMQVCNRIYYSKVYWRLNMFRAAHRSSSGALNCIFSLCFMYCNKVNDFVFITHSPYYNTTIIFLI